MTAGPQDARPRDAAARPVLAALAVLIDHDPDHGPRVLLVQRRNPPDAGLWGFPGGHVEPGETALAAAAR
ncbi:NUDIX domain-containing protein, partial [Paracoccus yeei]